MAVQSKLEVDFARLLAKCQDMVNKSHTHDWRLDKYIEALESKLTELSQLNSCRPNNDVLNNYKKSVNFLKGVMVTSKMKTPSDKLMATQVLSPLSNNDNLIGDDRTKEIHLKTQTKYLNEVRSELLGLKNYDTLSGGLRKRNPLTSDVTPDVDTLLKYHQNRQEKIAEEMISLAQNLKHNCTVSNQIIKKDTESLERTSDLAESNFANLRQNSDKLSDFVKRSCQYWLWIMLAIVSFTFLWMVVFIRMFPKAHY